MNEKEITAAGFDSNGNAKFAYKNNSAVADETLSWLSELKETTNDRFMPLYFDEHRYLVLMGGGGSGKSVFAGRKILERAVYEGGHRFLCVRKVAKTLRQSCTEQLQRQLKAHYPDVKWEYRSGENKICLDNGSEILFVGVDDAEKLKSVCDITGIWCEEASELTEQDFSQLDLRLRGESGRYRQIILTFNPISVTHWLKRRFFDETDARATVMRSTYRDNRFLDDDARVTLESFKDTDSYFYSVYCLGEWGVPSRSIFPSDALSRAMQSVPEPTFTGLFDYTVAESGESITSFSLAEADDGPLKIFEEPKQDCFYVIGADTAGLGGDYSVAFVLNNTTGEQAAIFRARTAEDSFARQLWCLGKYYNDALIAAETNYSSFITLELSRLKYPRQYIAQNEDVNQSVGNKYGFNTNRRTRPLIISDLIRAFSEDVKIVRDGVTLSEMASFVRDDELRPAAAPGCHDDCVMAAAIANFARCQQRFAPKNETANKCEVGKWSDSFKLDYMRATPAEKRYLRKKYGASK